MWVDDWPLGRPKTKPVAEFKFIKSVADAIEEFERRQIAMLGIKKELINTVMPDGNLHPDIEGTVMTLTHMEEHMDARGGHRIPPADVMVLLVIPPELCQGVQTAICKRLDGNGSSLKAFDGWVANAGIAAGIDPDEKVVIATKWELS